MIIQCTEEEFQQHLEDMDGVCLECGEWTVGGVEPDASKYHCDSCPGHGGGWCGRGSAHGTASLRGGVIFFHAVIVAITTTYVGCKVYQAWKEILK